MNNNFEKEYPRIYSLSTIGLIHHYNIDYLFHPFRTDFSGEAGIGKTTIANLLQLIFVGAKYFKPASNPDYKISGFVWQKKNDRQKNFGYAFINVEVDIRKYIVIGIFLKAGSNHVEHFIIQNGLDWENITPFNKPISYKTLMENEQIITLSELKNFVKYKFYCETFDIRKFQQILYENEILPFDLFQSEEKTIKYAQILKSFSAGKDIEWKNSDKLKEFLFGKDVSQRINQTYDTETANIEHKYETSYKNDKDIEIVTSRGKHIQELAQFKQKVDEAKKEYRIAKNVYWYYQKKELQEIDLKRENNNLWQLTTEILLLQKEENNLKQETLKKTISEIESKQSEFATTNEILKKYENLDFKDLKNKASEEFATKSIPYKNVQLISKFIEFYGTLPNLRIAYNLYTQQNEILNFQKYLTSQSSKQIDFLNLFNNSIWAEDFDRGEQEFVQKTKELEDNINQLKALKAFSNYKQENSLIRWSVEQNENLSNVQECVIAHFF